MASTAEVYIDGVDVTNYALSGSSTRILNKPSVATATLPMTHAIGGVGSLLKVYFDGVLHHHGRVLNCETDASEDTGTTVYNSTDPLELWQYRPVRDPDGDFTKPTIIKDNDTGPQIIEAMFDASELDNGVPFDAIDPNANAEGPLFLKKGGFAGGGVTLNGTPTDWPMTMAELAALLVSTGQVDIIITPIELEDSGYVCDGNTVYNHGQIDVYNGNYGDDLTSSVIFQYGMGLHNIRRLRWNEDMTNMANKIWYYLGPRKDQQHWVANVVGTDDFSGEGCGAAAETAKVDVQAQALASRCQYGTRMDIQVFDDRGDEAAVGYCLFRRRWLIEAWLRAVPRTLVHITPTRDTEIGTFDIGDLVLVETTTDVRGGFPPSAQRIYQYTIGWDTDSVAALEELQVSSDNET